MMRAVVIVDGNIRVEDVKEPTHLDNQLLVRVHSAGINGADILQMRGIYPPPSGVVEDIPGLEFAGIVEATGTGCRRFRPGDKVMGVVAGGAQAEFLSIDEDNAMPVPDSLPLALAGGFPETFFTAYDALWLQAGLNLSDRLAVQGAAGGVGLAAIQMAVAAGVDVTASVRKPDLHERVRSLGARVISPEEFRDSGPYDCILELVGAPNLASDLRELSEMGRIAIIGLGAGATTDIDLGVLMAKRVTIFGSTLRPRSSAEKSMLTRHIEKKVIPLLDNKMAEVVLHRSFSLDDASEAYRSFQTGSKFGKIILQIQ